MQKIRFVTQNVISLRHTQTRLSIDIPKNLLVIQIGKGNNRIPLDVDLSSFPNSELVSRHQAEIRREGNTYFLEDMKSANGTYLNQKRLALGHRYRLNAGDKISFGKNDLVGLRHFLAPKGAKKLSGQGKEVDDLKTPETLVNTRYMYIQAESTSVSRFEAIFASVFV